MGIPLIHPCLQTNSDPVLVFFRLWLFSREKHVIFFFSPSFLFLRVLVSVLFYIVITEAFSHGAVVLREGSDGDKTDSRCSDKCVVLIRLLAIQTTMCKMKRNLASLKTPIPFGLDRGKSSWESMQNKY